MKIGRKGSVQIAAFIKRMGMKIGYLCKKGLFFCVYRPKTQAFKEGQYCRVKTKMRLLKKTVLPSFGKKCVGLCYLR